MWNVYLNGECIGSLGHLDSYYTCSKDSDTISLIDQDLDSYIYQIEGHNSKKDRMIIYNTAAKDPQITRDGLDLLRMFVDKYQRPKTEIK